MNTLETQAAANRERLAANHYPGRGIVLGRPEAGKSWLQPYWTMGRRANSRKRAVVGQGAPRHTGRRAPPPVK